MLFFSLPKEKFAGGIACLRGDTPRSFVEGDLDQLQKLCGSQKIKMYFILNSFSGPDAPEFLLEKGFKKSLECGGLIHILRDSENAADQSALWQRKVDSEELREKFVRVYAAVFGCDLPKAENTFARHYIGRKGGPIVFPMVYFQ